MSSGYSRRSFLKGLGAAALSAPLLHHLGRAHAETHGPKRVIIFFNGTGTHPSYWFPTGTGSDFQLSTYLAPLAPIRDDVIILKGVDLVASLNDPQFSNHQGTPCILTGQRTMGADKLAGGPSVDQVLAEALRQTTPFGSLELGVQTYYNGHQTYERISWSAAQSSVPPEDDPAKAFQRVFGNFSGDDSQAEMEMLRAQKRSVLDFVAGDIASLQSKLDPRRGAQLNAQLTAVRALETRLGGSAVTGCQPPSIPTGLNDEPIDNANFSIVGKAQMDLMVAAMACDLTRVGTLMWSQGRSLHLFDWLDPSIDAHHHDLSHLSNIDSGSSSATEANEAKIRAINVFYAEQFTYLIEKLKSIPEGDGTMLDNTLVWWTNDLGEGRSHSLENIPMVLAGGGLNTGRFLQLNHVSSNDVLVSILNHMGVAADTFGDPAYCSGPLAGL